MKITLPVWRKHVYQSQDGRIIEAYRMVTTYTTDIPDGLVKVSEPIQFKANDVFFGVLPVAQYGPGCDWSRHKPVCFLIENAQTIEEAFEQFNTYAPKAIPGPYLVRR